MGRFTAILLIIAAVILGFAYRSDHKFRVQNPTALIVDLYPRSFGEVYTVDLNETLNFQFDSERADKPRAKVFLANNQSYWAKVYKNGQHVADVDLGEHFMIAKGHYLVKVMSAQTDKVVGVIKINSVDYDINQG